LSLKIGDVIGKEVEENGKMVVKQFVCVDTKTETRETGEVVSIETLEPVV
jgi:hypothetical protein